MAPHAFFIAAPLKGDFAGCGEIKSAPQSVKVGPAIHIGWIAGLFGGDEIHAANYISLPADHFHIFPHLSGNVGEAEVNQVGISCRGHQNVAGLHIAVN